VTGRYPSRELVTLAIERADESVVSLLALLPQNIGSTSDSAGARRAFGN